MQIGNVTINGKLALAPMAGVTDLAFRHICREHGAALTVTEQSADALSRMGFHSEIFVRRDQTTAYTREENIYFGRGDKYSDLKGVITYGGNNFRSSFAYGGVNALSG